MLRRMKNNDKGFTLVELIVVVAILGILAALIVPRIMGNVEDAKISREIANARTLASEITVYNATREDSGEWIDGDSEGKVAVGELDPIGGLPAGIEFPADGIVHIIVDDDGNASIRIIE